MKEVMDGLRPTRRALPVRRWAAYVTCAWTLDGYGTLKLYWALGGTALTSSAPLPRSGREELVAQTPGTMAGHWISVGLVLLGALAALATVRPWGQVLPRRPRPCRCGSPAPSWCCEPAARWASASSATPWC